MSTTPIASAHVCTQNAPNKTAFELFVFGMTLDAMAEIFSHASADTPPKNWVGNIAPGIRCKDDNAEAWDNPFSSDHTFYVDEDGRTLGTAQLHAHGYPECRGLWRVMVRQFLNGRAWDHRTWAVIDDFGWLVEVPA